MMDRESDTTFTASQRIKDCRQRVDPRTSRLRAAAPGSFADANSTIRSNASGAVDAVGAGNMSVDWWWFADYRSATGSSAPRPIDAIDASCGVSVVGGQEHTQTDNDNNR